MQARIKSELPPGIKFACFDCFEKRYPERALGLTSREPQPCIVCGDTEHKGVMINPEAWPTEGEPRAKNQGHPVKPKQGRLF